MNSDIENDSYEFTGSYKKWCLALHDYSIKHNFKRSYKYWNDVLKVGIGSFNTDVDTKIQPLHKNMLTLRKDLLSGNEAINKFINKSIKYQTTQLCILLSSLLCSIYEVKKQSDTLIHLMSSQRESFLPEINISNTMGFFAGAYPVRISALTKDLKNFDYYRIVENIKNNLNNIPKEGLDYFILKYLLSDTPNEDQGLKDISHLLFHFQRIESMENYSNYQDSLNIPLGNTNSPDNQSAYLLNISVLLTNDTLNMNCYYSSNNYRTETIQRFMDSFMKYLQQIIQ
jgi:non-ribosomal peptide synthase protein (TIGR01720 family)